MRVCDIWTKTASSFPLSLCSARWRVYSRLLSPRRQDQFLSQLLVQGLFIPGGEAHPASGNLLLRLNSRWLLTRGGTLVFHLAPIYGMEVLLWVQNIENAGILIVLALVHQAGVPCKELSWEHLDSYPPTTSILSQLLQWGSHAERCLTLWSRFKVVTIPVTTPSSRALTKRACLGENQATKHTALNSLPKGTDFICNSMKFKPKSTVKRSSVQFSSATQSRLTLCYPMECSTPGLPVHHQLPELTQTHVHRIGDAIQRAKEILDPEILVKGNWEVILGFDDSIA